MVQDFQSYWEEFVEKKKRVLLLQGPVGPFFRNLKHHLETEYHKFVYKINFNGGDLHYYPELEGAVNFTGSVEEFPSFLASKIREYKIDAVICFGDSRIYHQLARDYCYSNKISFWAFEEGYLRPHYITFEKWGVNYSSQIVRDCTVYDSTSSNSVLNSKRMNSFKSKVPKPVASGFWKRASMASYYYFYMWLRDKNFPRYQHHREKRLGVYINAWFLSGLTTLRYRLSDLRVEKNILKNQLNPFFIFPLQVHNDSQIKRHGRGKSVAQHLRSVIKSFAKNAPEDAHLVIKHHPMDKGFSNYQRVIEKLAQRQGVADRVHYVFNIPMPIFLRKSIGMVVVNSTSGISALIHGMPVKVIGDAHYDIPGLTATQSLDHFWKKPDQPDLSRIENYLHHLRSKTQLNGNFYYKDLSVVEFNEKNSKADVEGKGSLNSSNGFMNH